MSASSSLGLEPLEPSWLQWNVTGPGALAVSRSRIVWDWYRRVLHRWWRIAPLLLLPQSRVRFRFVDGSVLDCSSPQEWETFQNTVRFKLLERFLNARPAPDRATDGTGLPTLEFGFEGRTLRFRYDTSPLEIAYPISEIFLMGEYASLRVAGRQVVDVGAHWGDSPIFFLCRGARQVFGYEANPSTFRRGQENVQLNAMGSSIQLRLAACGATPGRIRVRSQDPTPGTWRPADSPDGVWIERTTLAEIVTSLRLAHATLKVDCEGCEYGLFSSSPEYLDPFDDVMVEYHRGPEPILACLRRAGFEHVVSTLPKRLPRGMTGAPELFGLIRASR